MPRHTETKVYLGISVDKVVLQEIDQRRGLIKRSTYLNDLLRKLVCNRAAATEEGGNN